MRVHKITEIPASRRPRQCQYRGGHLVVDVPILLLEIAPDTNLGLSHVFTYCPEHGKERLSESTGDPRIPLNKEGN